MFISKLKLQVNNSILHQEHFAHYQEKKGRDFQDEGEKVKQHLPNSTMYSYTLSKVCHNLLYSCAKILFTEVKRECIDTYIHMKKLLTFQNKDTCITYSYFANKSS